jgi:serine/threonine-protein kinase
MEDTHLDPNSSASRPRADPAQDAPELRSIGGYRLLRRLGAGGMGEVYLAYDEDRDLKVAIKVLGEQLASNQRYIDRFYREAKSGALLNHPNIVRTLSFGQDRGTGKHYLVMEYVDGGSAHVLLDRQGPLAVGDTVHLALDVARALEHAHSRNIVHRDIKPDNVLLSRSGLAKLSDLGLARRLDEASHLTATRQGFGTTPYMPYEQAINARSADARSDVYALGATLYHLVTGSVPFPGDNHVEVVEKKNRGEFAPASSLNPGVPAALDLILARMLAREPRDRYQTASELIIDLERSHLAVPVPTFADPTLALRDPWVRECLSSTEPTRPDVETPRPAESPAGKDVWLLRFRNKAGKVCKLRGTSAQLLERLRRVRLPAGIEGRRVSERGFRPLALIPEFESVRPAPRPAPPADEKPRPAPAESAVADAGQPWLIPSLCLIVGLLGMAVLLRLTGLWPF